MNEVDRLPFKKFIKRMQTFCYSNNKLIFITSQLTRLHTKVFQIYLEIGKKNEIPFITMHTNYDLYLYIDANRIICGLDNVFLFAFDEY